MTLSANQHLREASNPKSTITNAEAIRQDVIPCETDPRNGKLSRTTQLFHGTAVMTIGSQKNNKRHVCAKCFHRFHEDQHRVNGLTWD